MENTTTRLEHYRPSNPGNGALPVTRKYFDLMPALPDSLHRGDQFLAWLWIQGFKVVPLSYGNKLQEAWDASEPERKQRHEAAILELGRDPRRRG